MSLLLDLLNSVLRAPTPHAADHILWHDLQLASQVRVSDLHGAIAALRVRLQQHDAKRWLLYSENPCRFFTGLLALLSLRREVVICANRKPEWLGLLAGKFDAILSDEVIAVAACAEAPEQKPLVDFNYVSGNSPGCPTALSGDEALVFYTSGSTGQPKAVYKTLRALTNEIDTLLQVFSRQVSGRIFIASVSHLHIYGLLFRVLLPLAAKGSGVIQPVEFPEQLLLFHDKFAAQAGLVFISSPAFLARLDPGLRAVAMDAVFSSGGPLSFKAAHDSGNYFSSTPVEVYGSTETGGIGYRQQQTEAPPWNLLPGLTLTNMENGVGLLSPHMPGLPVYELDDNLEILADGRFILKGRKDRIVKIAEKRVSLTEIESFLEGLGSIQQCVALPLLQKREMVVCSVVLSAEGQGLRAAQGEKALINGWKEAMRSRFENVVIPRKWQILAEIPLNSQSKIDNARLLAGFTGKAN